MNKKSLKKRLNELLDYAKDNGFNSVSNDLKLLPENDSIAAIGFLANHMSIPPQLAFDVDTPLEGEK